MQNSLVNILAEARDSLTSETWRKREYFQLENNTICMCAHGAIQRIVNPKVKSYLEKLDIFGVTSAAGEMVAATSAASAAGTAADNVKNNFNKSLLQIWNERPYWVKKNNGYGSRDPHYLLGMVGLTIKFNDHPNTTLEMVKDKFNEAIELAKIIERTEI